MFGNTGAWNTLVKNVFQNLIDLVFYLERWPSKDFKCGYRPVKYSATVVNMLIRERMTDLIE